MNHYNLFCQRKPIPLPNVIFGQDMPEVSEKQDAFHQLRLIAKKGKKADGSIATRSEQIDAAGKVIHTLLTPELKNEIIHNVFDAIRHNNWPADTNKTIYITRPVKPDFTTGSVTVNALALRFTHELCDLLNSHVQQDYPGIVFKDKGLVFLTNNNRTFADPVGRIVRQHVFDCDEFKSGDMVILADDHIETGGAFRNMAQTLTDKGASILSMITLSGLGESKTWQLHDSLRKNLSALIPDAAECTTLNKCLIGIGLSIDTLSNREALALIAYLSDPGNSNHLKLFRESMAAAGCDPTRINGADPLWELYNQPPKRAVEFAKDVESRLTKERVLFRN
jgi:hypothetical protein